MSRSPKKKLAKNRMSVLVQTLVTPEVGRMVSAKAHNEGTAAYLRRLILADLGLLTPHKDTTP